MHHDTRIQRGALRLGALIQTAQVALFWRSCSSFGGALIFVADAWPYLDRRQRMRAFPGTVLLVVGPWLAIVGGAVGYVASDRTGFGPVKWLLVGTAAEVAAESIGSRLADVRL